MSRLTEPARCGSFDYRAGIDRTYSLSADHEPARWVIRVEWRRTRARRWETFLLVPDDGDTFEAVCDKIPAAIEAQARRQLPLTIH